MPENASKAPNLITIAKLQDAAAGLYDSLYINFVTRISSPLMDALAKGETNFFSTTYMNLLHWRSC